MRFDKAVNFFTFMIISLRTTLQNETAQRKECHSDLRTVYPHFLSGAGTIMNAYFREQNLPVNKVNTAASYLTYARENLIIMGNIETEDITDLCADVSTVCGNYLQTSRNGELIMASFLKDRPSPLVIKPNVDFDINPEHYVVTPKFSKLLPKTTTIRCIPFLNEHALYDFSVTKFTDSQYPIFVFMHQYTSDDVEEYELAYEILPINEVQKKVKHSKTSQLPAYKYIKKEVS